MNSANSRASDVYCYLYIYDIYFMMFTVHVLVAEVKFVVCVKMSACPSD